MDKKLSQLPIKNTPDFAEFIHILDPSDLTDSPQGSDKRLLLSSLKDNSTFNKRIELRFNCTSVGYTDILMSGLPANFFGDIKIKINKNLQNTSNVGTYIKLFYNLWITPGTLTVNSQKETLLFNDEIYVVAKLFNGYIRVYYNEGLANTLLVTLDIASTQGIYPFFSLQPFITTGTTVLESKTLIQTYDPDAPITPAQSNVGNITFTDFDGGIFIDLVTARQYVQQYTTAVITEESFSGKTYRFTVPRGTAMLDSFLSNTNSRFEFNDELGYIGNYGNFCFTFNQKEFKVTLGDFVTVGTPFLRSNQKSFEFTSGTNFTAGQNCINQNIKYFKAKFGAFANLGIASITGSFENFDVEIGDNSYLNGTVLTQNKKLFNAKIGSNCFLNNYAFYTNYLGFTATFGDNVTFGNFAFNDNTAGIINITFGNYLTAGADFYKNNASQNIIKIGNNATIGTATTVSLSNNNNITATIGDNFIANGVFQNTIVKLLKIGYLLSATNAFNTLTGRVQIYSNSTIGNIGTTVGQNFTNCFQTANNLILFLQTETQTCNAGQPDGDIQVAIANGITTNNLRYSL